MAELIEGARVTQYDPSTGGSVVVGGTDNSVPSSLNALTDAQYKFLATRQAGISGSLPQAVIGRFTGPAYPFGPSWALTLGPKSDLEVVFASVANILTTPLGTIPYRPFEGSEVTNLVFEPNDAVLRGLLRYYVTRDLRTQEPRAKVLTVRTVVPENNPHVVIITVAFQIVGDPSNRVFSAPIEYDTLSLAA